MEPQEFDRQLQLVLRGARRGARRVTKDGGVVEEATEMAAERFEDAVLRRKLIESLIAWGYTVGANAAKAIQGRRRRRARTAVEAADLARQRFDWLGTQFDEKESDMRKKAGKRGSEKTSCQALPIKKQIDQIKRALSREQLKMLYMHSDGKTYNAIAKHFRMDRSNVRRAIRRALRRLRSAFNPDSPPPSTL